MSINKTRGFLYFIARLLGDVNAVQKGPKAIAKRIGRKVTGRQAGKIINKWFK